MMSTPVKVLRTVEQIGKIVDLMDNHTHNGYPVVEDYEHNGKESVSENKPRTITPPSK